MRRFMIIILYGSEKVKYQLKTHIYVKRPYFKPQKSSHSRNCESLIINYSIGSDIHVYTDVTPIMEFTLLGLSFEVHLCIALKQRKIADFEIVDILEWAQMYQ